MERSQRSGRPLDPKNQSSTVEGVYHRRVPTHLTPFDLAALKTSAAGFRAELSQRLIPELYGVTDGKKVGTYVEVAFNDYLAERFAYDPGNAAKGIDFPDLNVDLKVTSVRQPQSSCPYRSASQKVFGLGYHLLVFVYEKTDDAAAGAAQLRILHLVFVHEGATADYQTTVGLNRCLDHGGNVDDIDAFLQERNLPLDDIGRRELAERVLVNRPAIGSLTISNAQQWRLQYKRVIEQAEAGTTIGVELLNAE